MSSGGGLREVVVYERLDHNGQNFSSLEYDNCRDLTHVRCWCNSCKSQFREKYPILPFEKFRFFVLAKNVTTPYYPFFAPLFVKNKGKFQTFSYKSGRGRVREVVAYKRFQIWWFHLQTFGILENWSLWRGDRLREVVATGGSTVQIKSSWFTNKFYEIRTCLKFYEITCLKF